MESQDIRNSRSTMGSENLELTVLAQELEQLRQKFEQARDPKVLKNVSLEPYVMCIKETYGGNAEIIFEQARMCRSLHIMQVLEKQLLFSYKHSKSLLGSLEKTFERMKEEDVALKLRLLNEISAHLKEKQMIDVIYSGIAGQQKETLDKVKLCIGERGQSNLSSQQSILLDSSSSDLEGQSSPERKSILATPSSSAQDAASPSTALNGLVSDEDCVFQSDTSSSGTDRDFDSPRLKGTNDEVLHDSRSSDEGFEFVSPSEANVQSSQPWRKTNDNEENSVENDDVDESSHTPKTANLSTGRLEEELDDFDIDTEHTPRGEISFQFGDTSSDEERKHPDIDDENSSDDELEFGSPEEADPYAANPWRKAPSVLSPDDVHDKSSSEDELEFRSPEEATVGSARPWRKESDNDKSRDREFESPTPRYAFTNAPRVQHMNTPDTHRDDSSDEVLMSRSPDEDVGDNEKDEAELVERVVRASAPVATVRSSLGAKKRNKAAVDRDLGRSQGRVPNEADQGHESAKAPGTLARERVKPTSSLSGTRERKPSKRRTRKKREDVPRRTRSVNEPSQRNVENDDTSVAVSTAQSVDSSEVSVVLEKAQSLAERLRLRSIGSWEIDPRGKRQISPPISPVKNKTSARRSFLSAQSMMKSIEGQDWRPICPPINSRRIITSHRHMVERSSSDRNLRGSSSVSSASRMSVSSLPVGTRNRLKAYTSTSRGTSHGETSSLPPNRQRRFIPKGLPSQVINHHIEKREWVVSREKEISTEADSYFRRMEEPVNVRLLPKRRGLKASQ